MEDNNIRAYGEFDHRSRRKHLVDYCQSMKTLCDIAEHNRFVDGAENEDFDMFTYKNFCRAVINTYNDIKDVSVEELLNACHYDKKYPYKGWERFLSEFASTRRKFLILYQRVIKSMNEARYRRGRMLTESELCDHLVNSIMNMIDGPMNGSFSMSIMEIPDEVMGDIADKEQQMEDDWQEYLADQALMDQDSPDYRNDSYEHGTY